jgi:amino acid transporter/nucleotide-binding universal stress UspA family protein
MSTAQPALGRAARVLIVSSVMFTFISYWRTAAVVLCDLASTAYYIGGIVEQSIGPAAPWFILAVMCFSYAVRWVYIESCTLFVRGGVYRVVREALGKFAAKLAVSALMFDYVLTGPISGVSAGQYLVGLVLDVLAHGFHFHPDPATRDLWKAWGSVAVAVAVTLYFFRQNLLGIHESSDKALKIMFITTVMGVLMLAWCGLTLALYGPATYEVKDEAAGTALRKTNELPLTPDLKPRPASAAGPAADPLGFISHTAAGDELRHLGEPGGPSWLSLLGLAGLFIAFGHSILAMSGEETLAQVYREVEAPKLRNFQKAAFIVFVYSLLFTAGISFLAVLLIPADLRLSHYADNLIAGLALHVAGPPWARLLLSGFVVVVGFLILSGAVNTAMIGSNGVLNRVAEDGVLPDWFLRPHPRYGTTYRVLYLILGLQLVTILVSRGDVIWLGEAYAFGVVWSFVFQALSMVVLRFKDRRPREFKVPLNIRVGGVEFPVGLVLILLVLLLAAVANLLTKETATIGGGIFTLVFFTVFWLSERYHERRQRGRHQHLEQFNEQTAAEIAPQALGLTRPYCRLVAVSTPRHLAMLENALAESDPHTTDLVVMKARLLPASGWNAEKDGLDRYDRQLMTAVVQEAEKAGKEVRPLVVPTNNVLHAILNTARDLHAQEVIVGVSNKYGTAEHMDRLASAWREVNGSRPAPLTVRIVGPDRDVYLDLHGGSRIPRVAVHQARTVAELRAAGAGVRSVLLVHDGSRAGSDLFEAVLTMLDPHVALAVVPVAPAGGDSQPEASLLPQDRQRAEQLGRHVDVLAPHGDAAREVVRLAGEGHYDLLIVPTKPDALRAEQIGFILIQAPCRVFLAAGPRATAGSA